MTVEEVYTNAFDARLVAWTEYGVSPYLNDTDTGYIATNTNLRDEGDWTFPASAGSGTINSVKLRFEVRGSVVECGTVTVYVWNGSAWVSAGAIGLPSTAYGWLEKDVSTILNTWAKINGAEVYLVYNKILTGVGYVRRLTRKVDYTSAVIPQAVSSTFPFSILMILAESIKKRKRRRRVIAILTAKT